MQVCICPPKYLYITSKLDQKRGVGKNQVRRLGNLSGMTMELRKQITTNLRIPLQSCNPIYS